MDGYRNAAEERGGFRFRGGCPVIDLTALLQARLKPVSRELLQTPDDLARWLVAAELVENSPETTDDDLHTARMLREAIFTLAENLHGRAGDAADARQIVNAIASRPSAVPVLHPDGHVRLCGSAATLLSTLAREAVHLFGGPAAALVKQCQSPSCALYFVDMSRRADRRWCSMSACGNKAKVAEFRRRRAIGFEEHLG